MTAAELTPEHIGRAIELYLKVLNGECEVVPVVPRKRKEYTKHKLGNPLNSKKLLPLKKK